MPRPAAPRPATEPGVAVASRPALARPPLYRVLLHNDDYTTMEFVVHVLKQVFHKPEHEAMRIMMAVHKQGLGMCGVFTAEVAETKVDSVHVMAKAAGYPLRASLEEV